MFATYELDDIHSNTLTSESVLERSLNWDAFLNAGLIETSDLSLITKYDKKPLDQKKEMIQHEGDAYAALFLKMIGQIKKDETLQYILALIEDMLGKNPNAVSLFLKQNEKEEVVEEETLPEGEEGEEGEEEKEGEEGEEEKEEKEGEEGKAAEKPPKEDKVFLPFFRILDNTTDLFVASTTSKILGLLLVKSRDANEQHVSRMFAWAFQQLRKSGFLEISTGVSALQVLLRKEQLRVHFMKNDGLGLLATLMKSQAKNMQLLYQVLYCAWLMSYSPVAVESLGDTIIIAKIVEITKSVAKEKVLRVSLAALKNMLGKGHNNQRMIESGLTRVLDNLRNKKWGDEDMVEDMEFLTEALAQNVADLSSFDIYKQEVLSGDLEWSPVHKSESFWRENAVRFEENNFRLIGVLKELISTSRNPTVLAVSCFDAGEFVRCHPRGKHIIDTTGLKAEVMKLMLHQDADVQKHALLCIQKAMVNHWEYLSG